MRTAMWQQTVVKLEKVKKSTRKKCDKEKLPSCHITKTKEYVECCRKKDYKKIKQMIHTTIKCEVSEKQTRFFSIYFEAGVQLKICPLFSCWKI